MRDNFFSFTIYKEKNEKFHFSKLIYQNDTTEIELQ